MKCRQNRLYGAGCDCHHTAPKIIRAGFLSCCSVIAVIYSKPCSAYLISSAMCHSLSSLIFLVWRCTSLHPSVALLNNFSCVALHIFVNKNEWAVCEWIVWRCTSHHPAGTAQWLPSSLCCAAHPILLCGTTQRQRSWWCGAAHPIILPWHY